MASNVSYLFHKFGIVLLVSSSNIHSLSLFVVVAVFVTYLGDLTIKHFVEDGREPTFRARDGPNQKGIETLSTRKIHFFTLDDLERK